MSRHGFGDVLVPFWIESTGARTGQGGKVSEQNPIRVFVTHGFNESENYLRIFEFLESVDRFFYLNVSRPDAEIQGGIDAIREELIAEINEYVAAKKKVAMGGIGVVAGEGRRIEYTPASSRGIDEQLRLLGYEARKRGLEIGGSGGAIEVEIG